MSAAVRWPARTWAGACLSSRSMPSVITCIPTLRNAAFHLWVMGHGPQEREFLEVSSRVGSSFAREKKNAEGVGRDIDEHHSNYEFCRQALRLSGVRNDIIGTVHVRVRCVP